MQRITECIGNFQALFRCQKCANSKPLSMAGDRELAVMIGWVVNMDLQPGGLETIVGLVSFRVDLPNVETAVAQTNSLVTLGGLIILSKHDVDQKKLGAAKPYDGPSTKYQEHQSNADHKNSGCRHQHLESEWAQAAVRMQNCIEKHSARRLHGGASQVRHSAIHMLIEISLSTFRPMLGVKTLNP